MARPKKNEDELRIHQVNIRLTEIENIHAKEQAQLTGLTVANWMRNSAFSKRALVQKVSPMHREYYKQLVGVSNNINQLTRKINQNQFPKIHDELINVKNLLLEINKIFHS